MDTIETRLARLGLTLPDVPAPAANYRPAVLHGGMLYISGQLPVAGGALTCRGRLGADVALEAAREAARLCAVNVLAAAKAALGGDLARISQILKITGFVASEAGFTDQHLVINGASDLLVEVLGEPGKHARAAVGVLALPLGAAVEVDAVMAVDEGRS